jgi:hypothetical protein
MKYMNLYVCVCYNWIISNKLLLPLLQILRLWRNVIGKRIFFVALRPNACHGLLSLEVSTGWAKSRYTLQYILLAHLLYHTQRRITGGRTPFEERSLVAETSTWQHTTLTTERHPCLRWDWNPQSQQSSGHWDTQLVSYIKNCALFSDIT